MTTDADDTLPYAWDPEHLAFLADHLWAVLATGRQDGSPQQSMVGYVLDDRGRLLISVKSYTAKWKNARRRPQVSLTVPEGRKHLVVYGNAEAIDTDPLRAELTADVFAGMFGGERTDPADLVETLDAQQRTVLRVTPVKAMFQA
jgi:PPOX class probable F420-dependent enzyme